MKGRFLILSLLFALPIAHATAQFEGILHMKTMNIDETGSKEVIYSMSIKNDRFAGETKSTDLDEQARFIYRGDKQVMWIINDEEKSYVEISTRDERASDVPAEAEEEEAYEDKLRKTGKKKTIIGYECDEWVVEEGDEVTSYWVTPKLGNIYKGLAGIFGQNEKDRRRPKTDDWEYELSTRNLFPLKVVRAQDGRIVETQEVTKIEAKSVPASLFEEPKGYTKLSFDDMLKEMMKQMEKQFQRDMENYDFEED